MKLKPIDILNEIRMQRALRPHQSALLLEGRTDCSYFRGIACKENCRIYPTNGKVIARKAAKLALDEGLDGVVTVLDRDHDGILGRELVHPNVVYTDENDLEIMVVKSPGFERYLNEYLDYDDRDRILNSTSHESISDLLLAQAGVIGVLRCLNTVNTWNLKCRDIEISEAIDSSANVVSANRLVSHVFGITTQANATLEEIERAFTKKLSEAHNKAEYAVGHDVTKLISFFLSEQIWIPVEMTVEPYQIEQGLRLCFSDALFQETSLHAGIRKWEKENEPYKLLGQQTRDP